MQSMSQASQLRTRIFQGEGDLLLDALVQACQTTTKPLLPGYGRDLVPFDFSLDADEVSPAPSARPKPVTGKSKVGGRPASKHPRAARSVPGDGSRSPKRQAVLSPAGKESSRPATVLAQKLQASNAVPAMIQSTLPAAAFVVRTAKGSSPTTKVVDNWAGSSVYNSAPRPEALPMPNDALLSPLRVRSVNAVATSGLKSLLQLSVAA